MNFKKSLVVLSGKLEMDEVPYLRGAVMAMANNQEGFHNHNIDSTDIYRYPRVQYKIIDGHPAIVGIDENSAILDKLFNLGESYTLTLGKRRAIMEVAYKEILTENITNHTTPIQNYLISNWLPLNQDNYRLYSKIDRLADKIAELDRILVGNILTFHRQFGEEFSNDVIAYIKEIQCHKVALYKDVKMVCLDVLIAANVNLPTYLGIGKGVSRGYGVINKISK